jgi:hypothetical protein
MSAQEITKPAGASSAKQAVSGPRTTQARIQSTFGIKQESTSSWISSYDREPCRYMLRTRTSPSSFDNASLSVPALEFGIVFFWPVDNSVESAPVTKCGLPW